MKFDKQNFKELLDKGANLVIDDDMPAEGLRDLAQLAKNNKRHITIVVRNTKLEKLKNIALEGEGWVTFDISSR
ncbi:MAG: hypothetical protein Q7T72_09135 [Bacteroidales bacterium]|nr:hypothetical protein [Bacteroidales bacterium]